MESKSETEKSIVKETIINLLHHISLVIIDSVRFFLIRSLLRRLECPLADDRNGQRDRSA